MYSIQINCIKQERVSYLESWDKAIALSAENVMVILANLSEYRSLDCYDYLMSDYEKKRLNTLFLRSSKDSFRLSRLIGRLFPSSLCGMSPDKIRISQENEFTKPFYPEDYNGLQFNISHTNEYVAVVFDKNRDVGIDVETYMKSFHIGIIADQYFTMEERKQIQAAENRILQFFTFWTRKEAVIKLMGYKLLHYIKNIEVLDGSNVCPLPSKSNHDIIKTVSVPIENSHFLSVAFTESADIPVYYKLKALDLKSRLSK